MMQGAQLKVRYQHDLLEAGVDEAGRGCLAGPVFAAAVILPSGFSHPLLRDSKKMSEKHRTQLRFIIEKEAVSWSVAAASAEEIDRINILQASFLAMHRAIQGLHVRPEFLIIDGNRFKSEGVIPFKTFVGGDNLYASIAAASVLAKTHRDEYMLGLHEALPDYGFNRNKGYGTRAHYLALARCGVSEHHRRSFTLLKKQGELFEGAE